MKTRTLALGCLGLINLGFLGVCGMVTLKAVDSAFNQERRADRHELTIRTHQVVLEALAARGALREEDFAAVFEAHALGEPHEHDGERMWVIRVDEPLLDRTEYPEISLHFRDGRFLGSHAYKP